MKFGKEEAKQNGTVLKTTSRLIPVGSPYKHQEKFRFIITMRHCVHYAKERRGKAIFVLIVFMNYRN
jgi:hypothetical protein